MRKVYIYILHASDIQIINSASKTINDIINKKVNENKNTTLEQKFTQSHV